jgi:hypothetical protein
MFCLVFQISHCICGGNVQLHYKIIQTVENDDAGFRHGIDDSSKLCRYCPDNSFISFTNQIVKIGPCSKRGNFKFDVMSPSMFAHFHGHVAARLIDIFILRRLFVWNQTANPC